MSQNTSSAAPIEPDAYWNNQLDQADALRRARREGQANRIKLSLSKPLVMNGPMEVESADNAATSVQNANAANDKISEAIRSKRLSSLKNLKEEDFKHLAGSKSKVMNFKAKSSKFLVTCILNLIDSFGLTLIYINLHGLFLCWVAPGQFCKLGDEWYNQFGVDADAVSGLPAVGETLHRYVTLLRITEYGLLFIVDFIIALILLLILFVIFIIKNVVERGGWDLFMLWLNATFGV